MYSSTVQSLFFSSNPCYKGHTLQESSSIKVRPWNLPGSGYVKQDVLVLFFNIVNF